MKYPLPKDQGHPETGRAILELCTPVEKKILDSIDWLCYHQPMQPNVKNIAQKSLLLHATTSKTLNRFYKAGVVSRYAKGKKVQYFISRQDISAHFNLSSRRSENPTTKVNGRELDGKIWDEMP